MSYSYKELELLCLDLALNAEPDEAAALRLLAENYRQAGDNSDAGLELSTKLLVAIVIAVYAIWTPLYFLMPRDPIKPMPSGQTIEHISGFDPTDDGRYKARVYRFARTKEYQKDPGPLVLFEDAKPLPKEKYELTNVANPSLTWRFIYFTASDGTDPRTNDRKYYVVLNPTTSLEEASRLPSPDSSQTESRRDQSSAQER